MDGLSPSLRGGISSTILPRLAYSQDPNQLLFGRGSHPVTMQGSITHPLHCPAYSLAFALWLFACFRRPFTAINNTLIVPICFMAFGAFGAGFYSAFPALLRGPFALNERRRPLTAPAFGPIYPILERNAAARSAARAARFCAFLLFFAPSAAARSARSLVTFSHFSARSSVAAALMA